MLCGCSCWVSLNADPAARRSRDRKQLPASEGSNCGGSTRGSRRHSLGAQTNTSESSTLQGGSLVLLSKQVASAQQGPSVRFERPDEERGLTYILCEAQFSSILASSPCCPCRRSWNAGSCGSPSCRWGRRQLEARALPASGSGAGVGSQTAPSRSLVTLSPSPVAELSTCPASRLRPDGPGPLTAPSSREIPTQLGHPGQLQGGDEESDHLGTAQCRLGPSSDTREPRGLAQWAAGKELRTSQHEIPCQEDPSRSVLGPHPPLPHPPEGSPTPLLIIPSSSSAN